MPPARPRNMYTAEKLAPAVAAASNLGEVLTNLGLEDNPKRRTYASERIRALGLDTAWPSPGPSRWSRSQPRSAPSPWVARSTI